MFIAELDNIANPVFSREARDPLVLPAEKRAGRTRQSKRTRPDKSGLATYRRIRHEYEEIKSDF